MFKIDLLHLVGFYNSLYSNYSLFLMGLVPVFSCRGYEETSTHCALGYNHSEGPVGWQQLYLMYQPSEFLHIL